MEKEIWKDIKGYENLYKVSNLGNIRSLGNGISRNSKRRLLRLKKEKTGYIRICLQKDGKRKYLSVHRLAGQAFIPNPKNKPCINHIDYNRGNNSIENLEWCTYSENLYHSSEKLSRKGTQNGASKLTEKQVIEIRQKYIPYKYNSGILAKEYNVSQSLILMIINHKIWCHIN